MYTAWPTDTWRSPVAPSVSFHPVQKSSGSDPSTLTFLPLALSNSSPRKAWFSTTVPRPPCHRVAWLEWALALGRQCSQLDTGWAAATDPGEIPNILAEGSSRSTRAHRHLFPSFLSLSSRASSEPLRSFPLRPPFFVSRVYSTFSRAPDKTFLSRTNVHSTVYHRCLAEGGVSKPAWVGKNHAREVGGVFW